MNLYQNQKSHSSGSSFDQIDINAFNTNITLISDVPQAINDDSPIAFKDYTKPSQQFLVRI